MIQNSLWQGSRLGWVLMKNIWFFSMYQLLVTTHAAVCYLSLLLLILPKRQNPGICPACGDDAKVKTKEKKQKKTCLISPTISHLAPGGGPWLQMTGALGSSCKLNVAKSTDFPGSA